MEMPDTVQMKEVMEETETHDSSMKNCEVPQVKDEAESGGKHNGRPQGKESSPKESITDKVELHEEEEEEEEQESIDHSKSISDELASDNNKSVNRSVGEEGTPSVDSKVKRERKKVERFVQEVKKEEVEVTGSGTPLGEIPYIEKMICKFSPEHLKILHRLAYNRPGTTIEVRRNLKKFRGFPFTEKDAAFERKKHSVEKIVSSELKKIADVLGIEKKGLKNELAEKIFNFLLSPHDLGRKIKESKRKSKGQGKGKKTSAKKGREKGGTKEKQKKATPQVEDEEVDEESSDEEEEEEETSDEGEEEEEPQKKRKKAPPSKKRKKSSSDSDEDSGSDIEPLVKKVQKPPTDGEVKAFIKKILDKANLEEVTMKKLCQQVYDNYPGHDLSHKKDFIKSTVKSILS